jgi:hypothetical protein
MASSTNGTKPLSGVCVDARDRLDSIASDSATQESIPLLAMYNRLSKRPSLKTVETVRCRHFSASFARAVSARCTRISASTPRISRTGTSSLFASCTITSAIFRGSPSERPSRLLSSILSIEPTEAPRSPAAGPAHSDRRAEPGLGNLVHRRPENCGAFLRTFDSCHSYG